MAFSAFEDKSRSRTDAEVAAVLGRAAAHWDELVAHMEERHAPIDREWGYAGKKWGWSLRLKQKKRAVLYMTPRMSTPKDVL